MEKDKLVSGMDWEGRQSRGHLSPHFRCETVSVVWRRDRARITMLPQYYKATPNLSRGYKNCPSQKTSLSTHVFTLYVLVFSLTFFEECLENTRFAF